MDKKNEYNVIKDLREKSHLKNSPLYQSDMQNYQKKGRPFGGQCWILDDSCEIIDYEFFNRHLTYVNFKTNGQEFLCIGVHMPFDDPKKKSNSKSLYELIISRICIYFKMFEERKIPVVILGDFNADPFRQNRFDYIFKDMIKELDLVLISNLNTQFCPYTYEKRSGNSSKYRAKLDHILINKLSIDYPVEIQCNILDDLGNMSDHRGLVINMLLKHSFTIENDNTRIFNKTQDTLINFKNNDILEFYKTSLKKNFELKCQNFCKKNLSISRQEHINNFYEAICDSFDISINQTSEFQNVFQEKQSLPKIKVRKKNWFNLELFNIKKRLVEIRDLLVISACDLLEKEKKDLKKNFRSIQRKNIFLHENKHIKRFEELSLKKNREEFWKYIKRQKKK
ncbi:unnamed protein product [Brachionus calyciflorus]|uniref:Endonuclease/exonuclease/phosphatase domain-containing protein n=1 Tax=Brachionus calyciflorus TaxID=104777 RepID=A0A814FIK3_9BILA|nr:unnamed protein product [Brachionus calyciflorus]